MSNLCKGSTNLWNKHVSSTLNCLFGLMCIDICLIIPGAAKDRNPPLLREKWDTPAALQTLRSYTASFFTPCQTPRRPALMVQQPPLNPFDNRHAGEGTNKAFAIFHTLSPLPHTCVSQEQPQTEGWQCDATATKVTEMSAHHCSMWNKRISKRSDLIPAKHFLLALNRKDCCAHFPIKRDLHMALFGYSVMFLFLFSAISQIAWMHRKDTSIYVGGFTWIVKVLQSNFRPSILSIILSKFWL